MKKRTMFFRMITASLIRRRSRMFIALLAIAVGATILSGLTTIYYDVPRQMGEQFRNYGANMIFMASALNEEGLTSDILEQGLTQIPDSKIVGCAPYRYETVTINNQPVIVAGTDLQGVSKTSPYWFVDGEWPSSNGQILIGKQIAETLSCGIGDTLLMTYSEEAIENPEQPDEVPDRGLNADAVNIEFTITGILDTGGNEESYIFMSLEDISELTGEGPYDVCELSVSASSEELTGYVDNITSRDLGITPRLVKRVTQSETTVLTKLQSLVFLVTIVVLMLMMICVATTMMAVVTERRKEIGLRKALGASDRSIVVEFMGEGMMLGAVGGLIGSFMGFAFAQAVSVNVFNSTITLRPILVPITIVASVIVTGIACLIPVRRTTEVNPALVLKGE
ncbi:MAG: ABC transporter permease [Clostridiales bacterium]|nr:ABC transporter permease [Clostridiales bacterium]